MTILTNLYFSGVLFTAGLMTESITRVAIGYLTVPKKLQSHFVPLVLCVIILWPLAFPLAMFVLVKRGMVFVPEEMFKLLPPPPTVYEGTCPFCESEQTLEVLDDVTDKCRKCEKTFSPPDGYDAFCPTCGDYRTFENVAVDSLESKCTDCGTTFND